MTSLEALKSLPRFPVTPHLLETRAKCDVCQETFVLNEEVLALPCIHQLYAPVEKRADKSHTPCILKWLDSSRSCPICRHEVGPARTQREIDRLAARERQDEDALNLYYSLMLDEWEDEERTQMANEAAINRLLLEDAATNPLEFSSESSSVPNAAAGSSQTKA